MSDAQTSGSMSPALLRVMQRAEQDPNAQFNSLAHLIDEEMLSRAFRRIRKDAAVGADGVTRDEYGADLRENIRHLHELLRTKRYRHQPIRRVHIPKGGGKTRPIGISTVQDKIVQGALTEVLSLVYEPLFLDCSYGYRPGRGAHDAVRALDQAVAKGGMNWILEADIASFFDSMDHTMLKEMLQNRVVDGSMLRLIGKCLKAGVLEGGNLSTPDEGTPQGSSLSPLLANVYLHHVLDVWFEQQVKPQLRGHARLIRYADDVLMCFADEHDALRVQAVLGKRLARFGLALNADKTRLVDMRRPPHDQAGGKGRATLDFLGFTAYWRRTRNGRWMIAFKTRSASLRKVLVTIHERCRTYRHRPVKDQHALLAATIRGHYNYFGVSGNTASLQKVAWQARRIWLKWLKRRSQRSRLTWERFEDLLRDFPLPVPRIKVQIWASPA